MVKARDYGLGNQKVKLLLFSNDVYNINYYHHNFNVMVSTSILENYQSVVNDNEFIMDGKLIKESESEIYYIENGLKRSIVDQVSFSYYGFDYNNVKTVSDNDVNNFSNGASILFAPGGGLNVYHGGGLEDGDFDSGIISYWNFNDWQNVADFNIESSNSVSGIYSAKVDLFSSVNCYDVELKQLVNIESSSLYHCSFWAKAENNFPLTLSLGKDTSPWNNYGLWKEITLTSDWKKYQYVFNSSGNDDLARFAFQLGSGLGELNVDKIIFEKIDDIEFIDDNLLRNHNFELNHYAPWKMEDPNSNAFYYGDESETYNGEFSFFVDPNQVGESYQVQLKQIVEINEGILYNLSFWAKAESNRSIFLNLCHDGSPWSNYGLWEEVNIDNSWRLYSFQFLSNSSGNPRFSFNFGHQDISCWIDDIILSDNSHINNIEDNIIVKEKFKLFNYPNPFNPSTKINFTKLEEKSDLLIFNIKGQLVKRFSLNRGDESIKWEGEDNLGNIVSSGIYFYVLKSSSYKSVIKKMMLIK